MKDIESLIQKAIEQGGTVESVEGRVRFIPPGGRMLPPAFVELRERLRGGFPWERLGVDDGGLPTHLPMGVTEQGQGPEDDSKAHHHECWCADPECPLTTALQLAWEAGRRQSR